MIKKSGVIFALTAILVIVFLIEPMEQGAIITANMYLGSSIRINSPLNYTEKVYQSSNINISISAYMMASNPEVSSISYSLDGNRNQTLGLSKVSTGGYLGIGTLNNLPDGYHRLDAYFHAAHFRIEKSTSTIFLVNATGSQPSPLLTTNPSPVPTQVPEFSWLTIIPLFVSLFFVANMLRQRKTTDSESNLL
jgi:hypothetical protein